MLAESVGPSVVGRLNLLTDKEWRKEEMTKKHFIELADHIINYNKVAKEVGGESFLEGQLLTLADFCKSQNPRFNRELWFRYIAGLCGPSGGKLK